MTLVPTRQILDEAAKAGYGVPHFNINNMEQAQAIMHGAVEVKSPVIMAASKGALKYAEMIYLRNIMQACSERYPEIPLALHLDHGSTIDICQTAIDLDFTSVMMDGSLKEDGKTPRDFDSNIEITKEVVKIAHPLGVTVEGELGTLGGVEDGVGSGQINLTDPLMVKEFLEKTKVDALAVAVGTSHGAYKFKIRPDPDKNLLAMDIIREIHRLCPNLHMVMHGSSSVPEDLVAKINKYGGAIPETYGVPLWAIKEGIDAGVRKVNVDTDLRLAATGAIRKVLHDDPAVFDMRKYLIPAREAMKEVIIERFNTFGSAGHAFDYTPMSIGEMAKFYRENDLLW